MWRCLAFLHWAALTTGFTSKISVSQRNHLYSLMSEEKKSWNLGIFKEFVFQEVATFCSTCCCCWTTTFHAFFVPHLLANSSNHSKISAASNMDIVFTPTCSPTKIPRCFQQLLLESYTVPYSREVSLIFQMVSSQ